MKYMADTVPHSHRRQTGTVQAAAGTNTGTWVRRLVPNGRHIPDQA